MSAPDDGDAVERLLAALVRRRASGERVAAARAGAVAAARVTAWATRRALVPDDALLDDLGVPEALAGAGIEVLRWPAGRGWRDLLGLDGPPICGVTLPAAAVADRGTLVLHATRTHGRAIDVVGSHHLAVVPADRVVPTLEAALAASFRSGRRPPSAVSLVSGPSRTSDIEKISTLGAHGALAEHVLVVDPA